MNVYIKSLNNFPTDDWGVSALHGFRSKGANIILFEDIDEVPLNRNTLLVSDIKDTRKFFKDMGFTVKEDITYPVELWDKHYLWKRSMTVCTSCEIDYNIGRHKVWENFPRIFCKPLNVKRFQHGIIKGEAAYFEVYDTKEDIIFSEIVNFESEYRCFIIDGKIKSCQHYLGSLYKYPDLKVVDKAIELFKSAPMGYSIDVGVLDTGETALVELNDGWSLGSYGCDPRVYSRLLAERWVEILKQNPYVKSN